jgi:phosphate transport system substrate-binding protein
LLLLCTVSVVCRGQNAATLSQVKKVYVDSLGESKDAAEIRTRLIRRLEKSSTVQIVQSPNEADAIVKGTAQIWTTGSISLNPRSHAEAEPTFEGFLSVEVVGEKDEPLWSYLVTPGKFPMGSIQDDLASQMAGKLIGTLSEKGEAEQGESGASLATRVALKGAGGTFPAPLYQKWFESFEERHPEVSIKYDAVGSAEGIEQFAKGLTDFGASDMPVSVSAVDRRLVEIPTALGAVVPIYNVPRFSGDIRFTPAILAGIYLGKIKRWNDPQIIAANHGAALPAADIVVVHRAEGSGTTFIWSDYLSKVSNEWRSAVGSGLTVKWPLGVAAVSNDGVASTVQSTPNSIGYVEFIYAVQHELRFAAVENSRGHFIKADIESVRAAVPSDKSQRDDLRASITNSSESDAYPIVSFTWILLPVQIADSNKRTTVVELLRWMLTVGQKSCAALGYAPLPADVAGRALTVLDMIH